MSDYNSGRKKLGNIKILSSLPEILEILECDNYSFDDYKKIISLFEVKKFLNAEEYLNLMKYLQSKNISNNFTYQQYIDIIRSLQQYLNIDDYLPSRLSSKEYKEMIKELINKEIERTKEEIHFNEIRRAMTKGRENEFVDSLSRQVNNSTKNANYLYNGRQDYSQERHEYSCTKQSIARPIFDKVKKFIVTVSFAATVYGIVNVGLTAHRATTYLESLGYKVKNFGPDAESKYIDEEGNILSSYQIYNILNNDGWSDGEIACALFLNSDFGDAIELITPSFVRNEGGKGRGGA